MVAPIEPTNPSNLFSPFVPATVIVPLEQDRLRVFLTDKLSQYADVINDKTIGTFTQNSEAFNGLKFGYDTTKKVRNGYQFLVRIQSFPNTGVVVLTPPPDINPQFIISDVWGTASKPPTAVGAGDGDFFSFRNQGDTRVSFTFTDIAITLTTTTNLSAYSGFISILYIRDGI